MKYKVNLFSITAPLVIRYPDGDKHLMIEHFSHPDGLVYFKPFWHVSGHEGMIHVVKGEIKGEGPWKVGSCIVTVAGCHGSDPKIAMEFSDWKNYLMMHDGEYLPKEQILEEARKWGASVVQT